MHHRHYVRCHHGPPSCRQHRCRRCSHHHRSSVHHRMPMMLRLRLRRLLRSRSTGSRQQHKCQQHQRRRQSRPTRCCHCDRPMTSRSAPIHPQMTRPHQWPCRSQAIHCRCCHHPQSIPQQTRSSRHQQQLRLRRHRCAPPQSRPPMTMMMMCRQHAQPRFRHSRSRARHSGIRCRHCRSRPHQRPHTCRRHHQHLPQRMSRRCIPTRHRFGTRCC